MKITKEMIEQLPGRQPRLEGGRELRYAVRELATVRGLLSAIQTRCMKLMDRSGELAVDYPTKVGAEVLGEHLYQLVALIQAEQKRTLAITNQLREKAGMARVEEGKTSAEVQNMLEGGLGVMLEELMEIARRSKE